MSGLSRASNQRRGSIAGKISREMERFSAKQRKFCKSAIQEMKKDTNSSNFAQPVLELWDAADLPGYEEKVPNPMDLGTIGSRLDSKDGYIGADDMFSVDAFVRDVKLTFKNAMDYNGKGAEMYHMAQKFLKWFANYMKDVPVEIKHSNGSHKGSEKHSASDAELSGGEAASEGESVPEEARDALLTRADNLRAKQAAIQMLLAKPLTLSERVDLRDEIERMNWPQCQKVVDVLRKNVDTAIGKEGEKGTPNPSYVDVDLDEVEPAKLRELWAIVWGEKPSLGTDRAKSASELAEVEEELESLEANLSGMKKMRQEGGRENKRRRR